MRICIPILEDRGLDSEVSAHFGSAPAFLFVDVESGACQVVANGNQHHAHGACQPLAALAGQQVDAVVVGGIGQGALARLAQAGLGVFRAAYPTVGATVKAFQAGTLEPLTPATACGGHGAHGGHGPHDHAYRHGGR